MAFAANAISREDEAIWDMMQRSWGKDPDYVFVCVGLGGGTGGGTAKKLVELARKYMESCGRPVRVGVIASIPAVTEGQQVCRNAVNAMRELVRLQVSPLILVDNAKINAIYQPSMSKLFPTANAVVAQLLHLFNQLAAVHSQFITFDRSELAQLLDNGLLVMGAADVTVLNNPADVSTAIRENLTNNVLAGVNLNTGNKGACLFVANNEVMDQLGLEYFEAGFTQMNRTLRQEGDVVVHRGVYGSDGPGLQAYAMISGLEPPYGTIQMLAKQAGMLNSSRSAVTSMAEFFDL
jgi:cell division GTPase FtsZ